jgi:osmoprotectant transport system permease protein
VDVAEEAGVSFFQRVFDWFANGDHWSGPSGVTHRLVEHLQLSAISLLVAMLVALPIGIVLGHFRRGGAVAINTSNVGRAVPSFALLILMVQVFGIKSPHGVFSILGSVPTFIALVALAVPPMVTNSYVGVASVDDDIRESARGMGMRGGQTLWRVELPLALPLIMAGIRTAAVAIVATAALAAYIGWGGLGRFIIDGLAQQDYPQVFAGASVVALLSIAVEVGLGALQRVLVPKGLSDERVTARPDDTVSGAAVVAGAQQM